MWKNIAHFFAVLAQKVLATKPVVEEITADIPKYGALALPIEDVVYGIFGEIAKIAGTGTAEQQAALATAGVSPDYLAAVKDVLAKNATVTAMAKVTLPPVTSVSV